MMNDKQEDLSMKRNALLVGVLCVMLTLSLASLAMAEDLSWLKKWDGVKLVLSSHQGPSTDAYKVLCEKFEELTGAEVQVIDESWTDLLSKHLAAAAAHTGTYDILTWPYIWTGQYVEGDLIEDLNDWFAKDDLVDPNYDIDDFIPAVLEVYGRYKVGFFTDPDALWSVPYKFDIYLAQYRTDLFEQAGIVDDDGNAKPPATWEELLEDAKILAEKFPDMKPVTIPLAVDDPMVATFLPILCAYGGDVPMPWFDENLYPTFHGPEGVAAIKALKALMPYMPPDVLNFDYDKVNTQMAQGLTAYALNWNAYLPVLVDPEKSKIVDVVAFDLVPGGPAGRPQGLGGWQMGISNDSKNKEAAFQLLQYLTGKERGVELALAGGSVARKSVSQDPRVIEKYPFYPFLIEAMENVAARGMDRAWQEVQRIIGVGLNEILLGADAEETLRDTAGKVFDAVQQTGYTPEKTGPRP
ncbi:extracellular solute-binding protein [candidate division KSB3 bacterium]|uniref:Extracellular solute-binding protein n=1 Tax=candidate division KSB3 bacterium TaxID=2044937 RepID=A0A9D5Q822_9BACT|nr:extracellular solute-binding protein [candidate division KSB3 bacterium]MBD3327525.1 extracellular solute-binding protein [candidate division KSB3 bacterium]